MSSLTDFLNSIISWSFVLFCFFGFGLNLLKLTKGNLTKMESGGSGGEALRLRHSSTADPTGREDLTSGPYCALQAAKKAFPPAPATAQPMRSYHTSILRFNLIDFCL